MFCGVNIWLVSSTTKIPEKTRDILCLTDYITSTCTCIKTLVGGGGVVAEDYVTTYKSFKTLTKILRKIYILKTKVIKRNAYIYIYVSAQCAKQFLSRMVHVRKTRNISEEIRNSKRILSRNINI